MPMPSPRNFWKNQRGAVAVTVALASVVLFVAGGIAVDMARAYRAKHALQYNVDQAAIAAAAVAYSENPGAEPDLEQMTEVAAKYFSANNALSEDLVVVVEPPEFSYSGENDDLVVSVPATVETTFLKIVDINEIRFTVSSNVARPEWGPLELVLALDSTWSMSALLNGTPKYVTLQTAAKDLITLLSENSNASVGIVPFATHLKVPSNYWGESWIKVPSPYSSAGTVCTYPNKKGCTMVPGTSFECIRDGVPATCYNDPYETCTDWGAPSCFGSPGKIFSFDGCISSRVGLLDSIDSATTIPYWGLFPYWNSVRGPCAQTLMLDLTKAAGAGKQTLVDRINQLVPVNNAFSQNTYIAGGLEFAMHMLTPGIPFNTALNKVVAQELGLTMELVVLM
jgi:Flp pilus assembly protein TadG